MDRYIHYKLLINNYEKDVDIPEIYVAGTKNKLRFLYSALDLVHHIVLNDRQLGSIYALELTNKIKDIQKHIDETMNKLEEN